MSVERFADYYDFYLYLLSNIGIELRIANKIFNMGFLTIKKGKQLCITAIDEAIKAFAIHDPAMFSNVSGGTVPPKNLSGSQHSYISGSGSSGSIQVIQGYRKSPSFLKYFGWSIVGAILLSPPIGFGAGAIAYGINSIRAHIHNKKTTRLILAAPPSGQHGRT